MPRPLRRRSRLPLALSLACLGVACKDKGIAEQPKAKYENTAESQLDMVAHADRFLVVRDLRPFADVLRMTHGMMETSGRKFLDLSKASDGDRRDFEEGVTNVGKVLAGIDASGMALEKGLVVSGDPDEDGLILFPIADLDGVKKFVEALDEDTSKVDEKCVAAPGGLSGWVGCAKAKASVEAYQPGKQGKARHDEIAQQLPNFDLGQANLLGAFPELSLGMTTDPGLFSLAVHPKEKLPEEVGRIAGKGKAKAMRYAATGDGFVWARVDVEAIMKEAGNDVPPMARAPLEALDGELYLGGVGAVAPGGALLVGLSNPVPIRGFLDMALAMRGELPTSIPDIPGSSLALEVTDAKAGDQAYRIAELKVDAPELKKAKDMGVIPSAIALVGPEYATVGLGMTAADGEKLVNHGGEGPSEALLATLPPAASADLRAGEVTLMYHAPYDILQSPAMLESLTEVMKEAPADAEFDPAVLPEIMKVLAPLSSVTAWASHLDSMPVFHVAVATFGDERSEQGKAERAAMTAVASGKSAKDEYGALASKFDKSSRAAAYRARAATSTDVGSAMGFAGLGIAAAVAIPAFMKYTTRSKMAAVEAERAAMEAAMEAERAAMEAELDAAQALQQP